MKTVDQVIDYQNSQSEKSSMQLKREAAKEYVADKIQLKPQNSRCQSENFPAKNWKYTL
jgi:hypothetical protein